MRFLKYRKYPLIMFWFIEPKYAPENQPSIVQSAYKCRILQHFPEHCHSFPFSEDSTALVSHFTSGHMSFEKWRWCASKLTILPLLSLYNATLRLFIRAFWQNVNKFTNTQEQLRTQVVGGIPVLFPHTAGLCATGMLVLLALFIL